MVHRSCGKDNCKGRARNTPVPPIHPIAKWPRHQGTRWCPSTIKQLILSASTVLERDSLNRAIVPFFFFLEKTTALPDKLGCCLTIQFPQRF